MRIAVVGTGAMGSVYAGMLHRAGHDVWAIDIWSEHVAAIVGNGLHLTGASGTAIEQGIQGGTTVAQAGACDLWLIGTKAQAVTTVAAQIVPLLRPDDVVMAFQNGLGAAERLATHIPERHVMIGIAEGFGSSVPMPGHVHHHGMRLIRIGEMHGGFTDRLQRIEALWRDAGFNVKGFADVQAMIWEKFVCNVTLSAPTAAFDLTVGELMANPQAWAVALGCAAEAWQVGIAKGVQFSFADPLTYVSEFSATIPNASPSMRLDHLARRRSEVDVINGAVVDLGREVHIDTPYNETLCAILRERESRFDGGPLAAQTGAL